MLYLADALSFVGRTFIGCFSGASLLHVNLLLKNYMIQICAANSLNDLMI